MEVTNQEIQHCLGFEHTPVAGRFDASTGLQVDGFTSGDFSLHASLYPFATGTIQGRTFEPDDIAAFSTLYPSSTANTSFGKISGIVRRADNSGVKGAHVVAVPASDPMLPKVGDISGVAAGVAAGAYTITGLAPGSYFVRIEPLVGGMAGTNAFEESNTFFTGFDTSFPPEFYSGGSESASDVTISSSDAAQVTVTAGVTTSNIDIVVNASSAPTNDNFTSGAVITSTSFTQTVDTTSATTETGDPTPPCGNGSRNHSVWFRVTTATSGTMTVDTFGSDYDTILSTWTGSSGSFVAVLNGCNDDSSGTLESRVSFSATAGTTYSFMVTSFGPTAGTLVFHFSYTGQVAGEGPSAVSVSPASGTGSSQTFSLLFSDPNGFADLSFVLMLMNSTQAPVAQVNGCIPAYLPAVNQLWLQNDSGSAWLGPAPMGVAGTLQNSQCAVDLLNSSASRSGTNLTLNLALSFKPSFLGTKLVLLYAVDNAGLTTGWQARGTWTVP